MDEAHNDPDQSVMVIAVTNSLDLIDPSLLRPGRFDKIFHVPSPDSSARTTLLAARMAQLQMDPKLVDTLLPSLVSRTEGSTGSDILNIVQSVGLHAFMRCPSPLVVTSQDFATELPTL